MNKFYTLFLLSLFFCSQLLSQDQTLTPEQLKADATYLHSQLNRYHPNLYLYNDNSAFAKFFEDLDEDLSKPITELEFYRKITPINSIIKDGHTLFYPSTATTQYHNLNSSFFPFQVYWDGDRLYSIHHFTEQNTIPDGSEIRSINGQSSKAIMEYITDRMMRDGHNLNYPIWVLNNYFSEYFSYFFRHPKQFQIEYISKENNDTPLSTTVKALKKDQINQWKKTNYPQINFSRLPGEGLALSIDGDVAILTIEDFHVSILKKVYQQNFKKLIPQFFEQIQAAEINHLVLDLRDNQGGNLQYGKLLLSYLMNDSFTMVQYYEKVQSVSTSPPLLNRNLKRKKGTKQYTPKKDNYKGDLIVLINGGSFSNSGIVSNVLQKRPNTQFWGEMTGGSSEILAGHTKNITLPNSQIRVEIPILRFVLTDVLKMEGKGIKPHKRITPQVKDLIIGKDTILELAKKRL